MIAAAKLIRSIDPKAIIMAGDRVDTNPDWIRAFLAAGGARAIDIFSIHSYEGNGSIDRDHWLRNFGLIKANAG